MSTENKPSYKETLNLPQTPFPMEAKLIANEPARLKKWQDRRLYEAVQARRESSPLWLLHDGPPFANGDIHIGHVVNKTLKDIFLRYKTMAGFRTPYVPGWDCHGLPIEHKIQEQLKGKMRELTTVQVRQQCFAYAQKYATLQSTQFERLGILGDWAHPYMTMAPAYEAATLDVFARFVAAGLVYKQLKPVAWSTVNQTALADAELEYKDVTDNSVFVEFPAANPGLAKSALKVRENAEVVFIAWTTTPWTLPANLAIAVNPSVEYALVKYAKDGRDRVGVVAADLVKATFAGRVGHYDVLHTVTGQAMVDAKLTYTSPLTGRTSPLLAALYVTTTDGTGLVHTAPGHGEEDYGLGVASGLEVYCPVLADGRFDDTAPDFVRGKKVFEANPLIVERLKELGILLGQSPVLHSYPHDWRSKTPIIFRATEQWFIAIDRPYTLGAGDAHAGKSLRQRASAAIDGSVDFVPNWGRARITGMLQSRPDWCISRQRAWGLPIPVFYNPRGQALLTPESVRAVAQAFATHGSDAWFNLSPRELLGRSFEYPDGFNPDELRKEQDIFDVWFESGSSWNSVCRARPELGFPADLYLEGSDQHRGWFQLSLLPALGATGTPPYKRVLTHGFVVKPDGTKVSKSDKEYVTATQEVERHGADVLRLWTSSMDYQGDLPASPQIIKDFGDKYRKIRNTIRYLLSNLADFDASAPAPAVPPRSLDAWALAELDALIVQATDAYDNFQTHRAFRLLHDFCAVQISAVYGNAMKDRMYCDTPGSVLRRRAQYVMHQMAGVLIRILAPVAVFTADEAWEFLPKTAAEAETWSVHLTDWPKPRGQVVSDAQRDEWKAMMELRDSALAQLDVLKREKGLNKALDAMVVYRGGETARAMLADYGVDLEDLVGAGCHRIEESDGPTEVVVVDIREKHAACARSWKRRPDIGPDGLSPRDSAALAARK